MFLTPFFIGREYAENIRRQIVSYLYSEKIGKEVDSVPKILNNEKDIEKREIGDNLRLYREAAGLSQSRLADALDVGRNVVHRYETGENAMSLPTAAKIASILHISVDDLIPAKYRKKDEPEVKKAENIENTDPRINVLIEQLRDLPPENADTFFNLADIVILGLNIKLKTA